ncbi:MAG: response regulator [Xanthomonadales bacterium]|nr:response regulator [Xanthomonadales bacterium]
MQTHNILLVDDDAKLRKLVKNYLCEHGFGIETAMNTKQAIMKMNITHYDLILLDLMMPGEDGLSFCQRLRAAKNHIPIIMLSARGDDVDKIIGLEIGVDDYLGKPFNPRELLARIHAVLRRPSIQEKTVNSKKYQVGKWLFNTQKRSLTHPQNNPKALTTGEFNLLMILVENPNRSLSRDQLMQLLNDRKFEVYDRSIDVQISRLRKLLEENPNKPTLIKTIWGHGYMYCTDSRL